MAYATKTSYMWANWLNLALAVWLFISPWVLGYAAATTPAWNAWICGVVIGVVAAIAIARLAEWEDWVTIAFGVWLFISPWVLRFTANSDAATNAYIVGILFAALGIWGAWAARKEISTHGTAQPMGR